MTLQSSGGTRATVDAARKDHRRFDGAGGGGKTR